MSPEKERRIKEAIAECERFIAKEGPRAADLRPANVQQMLDHAYSHKAKLESMLKEG